MSRPHYEDFPVIAYDHCEPCGKFSYASRKHAKKHARKMSRSELSAYQCPHNPNRWHIGHLPRKVIAGQIGRDDIEHRSRS